MKNLVMNSGGARALAKNSNTGRITTKVRTVQCYEFHSSLVYRSKIEPDSSRVIFRP